MSMVYGCRSTITWLAGPPGARVSLVGVWRMTKVYVVGWDIVWSSHVSSSAVHALAPTNTSLAVHDPDFGATHTTYHGVVNPSGVTIRARYVRYWSGVAIPGPQLDVVAVRHSWLP